MFNMSHDTFYKWVIDCPDNVPAELQDFIMNNNELSDVEIDIDFITFDTYGESSGVNILFDIIEKILTDAHVHYYMEAVEYTSTGAYMASESEDDE